jgi:hypothetical protein
MPIQNYSTTITDYFSYCGWWRYWGRTAVTCIPSEYITLDRCFWEKITSGQTVKKNGEVIEHYSVTLSVGPHLITPYGYTNNTIGKESIFLNRVNNNFLKNTNYNYSCTLVTLPGKKQIISYHN